MIPEKNKNLWFPEGDPQNWTRSRSFPTYRTSKSQNGLDALFTFNQLQDFVAPSHPVPWLLSLLEVSGSCH